MREQTGGRFGGGGLVGVAEYGERTGRRGLDQSYGRLRHHSERSLAAAEGAGEVGAAFGQEGVQGVSGDAARELGESGAQRGEVGADESGESGQSLGGRSPGQAQGVAAVAGHGQGVRVVGGGAPGDRVRAAGVVADHAAQRAAAVRGRVGAEGEAVRGGGGAQLVQDHARLDDGGAGDRVQLDDLPQVAGEIEHDAGAGGLPRDGGAAAARHHGHPVRAADRERGGHVVGVTRGDDAQRYAAVVGGVHRRQRPGGGSEVDLAADRGAQGLCEFGAFRRVLGCGHAAQDAVDRANRSLGAARFPRIRQYVGIRRTRSHIRNRERYKVFPKGASILI